MEMRIATQQNKYSWDLSEPRDGFVCSERLGRTTDRARELLDMNETWKIAGFQMDCELGKKSRNLERILGHLVSAHQQQVRLAIFPECALPGYCFDSKDEAWSHAE